MTRDGIGNPSGAGIGAPPTGAAGTMTGRTMPGDTMTGPRGAVGRPGDTAPTGTTTLPGAPGASGATGMPPIGSHGTADTPGDVNPGPRNPVTGTRP